MVEIELFVRRFVSGRRRWPWSILLFFLRRPTSEVPTVEDSPITSALEISANVVCKTENYGT